MDQIELNDGNADRYLLDTPGLSLLVFHSRTCGTCRIARQELPWLELPPVQRVLDRRRRERRPGRAL